MLPKLRATHVLAAGQKDHQGGAGIDNIGYPALLPYGNFELPCATAIYVAVIFFLARSGGY
ncbi:MAG: hypothetical protein ABSG03_15085 [Bryobacteraceae bacterium]|jgi:hypothetical protein